MTICPSCGTENGSGRKFCGGCAAPLEQVCAACGSANEPGMRFCGECAQPLDAGSSPPGELSAPSPLAVAAPPLAERRVVSVLFADLVGFTTLSEDRDSEEVRELLTAYFDRCRRLIGLYGGTVEKFIGDAVMAVWGTPVAQEDDAERAVRTALDLVQAVSALGQESSAPDLRLRAGVLTGEAAVTLGAEGQGMIAGDLVNTSSRIQSAAEPGTVLVGDSTRRASEAAIAYVDAGVHELKGKAEPVQLWRALRVTAGRGGAQKSTGLEPPFVGRERELRLVKELFHGSRRGADGASRVRDRHRGRRQVASRLGVLQVHRRSGGPDLVAPRAVSRLRRGRHLLGARGDGARAGGDPRGRGPGVGARQAPSRSRAAGRRPGGAGLDRAAARPPAGARRGRPVRARGPVRGLAPVLRADVGAAANSARLRGHAVGRRLAARVRRVPARLVAKARDLRPHPRAPRARGPSPGLGGGQAELQRREPRAAVRKSDGRAAHRVRARAPRVAAGTDSRTRRGGAPLRRRDDPHAPRPRAARAARQRVPADRADRSARGARRRCTR